VVDGKWRLLINNTALYSLGLQHHFRLLTSRVKRYWLLGEGGGHTTFPYSATSSDRQALTTHTHHCSFQIELVHALRKLRSHTRTDIALLSVPVSPGQGGRDPAARREEALAVRPTLISIISRTCHFFRDKISELRYFWVFFTTMLSNQGKTYLEYTRFAYTYLNIHMITATDKSFSTINF